VVYEGYGPGGTAILIEALTDNVNRTVGDVRSVFTKRGGSMGNSGSVAWQFESKGIIQLAENTEAAQEAAIELGAEDLQDGEEGLEISTAPTDLYAVSEGLTSRGFTVVNASLTMLPSNTVSVAGADADKLMTLIEYLEDLDDVQNVYSNADMPEEVEA